MTTIRVQTVINAGPATVWDDIRAIETHREWMADAVAIRFRTDATSGLGVEFECDTRIGPFRTTDVLRVVEWEPERSLGIVHRGAVTGSGRFTLEGLDGGSRTRFAWEERLRFPWWLGGALGARMSRPLLDRVWSGNLRRLKTRIESPS